MSAMAKEKSEKKYVADGAKLNAAPELKRRWNFRNEPKIFTGLSPRYVSANCFVAKSKVLARKATTRTIDVLLSVYKPCRVLHVGILASDPCQ